MHKQNFYDAVLERVLRVCVPDQIEIKSENECRNQTCCSTSNAQHARQFDEDSLMHWSFLCIDVLNYDEMKCDGFEQVISILFSIIRARESTDKNEYTQMNETEWSWESNAFNVAMLQWDIIVVDASGGDGGDSSGGGVLMFCVQMTQLRSNL